MRIVNRSAWDKEDLRRIALSCARSRHISLANVTVEITTKRGTRGLTDYQTRRHADGTRMLQVALAKPERLMGSVVDAIASLDVGEHPYGTLTPGAGLKRVCQTLMAAVRSLKADFWPNIEEQPLPDGYGDLVLRPKRGKPSALEVQREKLVRAEEHLKRWQMKQKVADGKVAKYDAEVRRRRKLIAKREAENGEETQEA